MMYQDFAEVYDQLMSDVDYASLCSYFLKLCKKYNHKIDIVLDACCGSGLFTEQLLINKLNVIGVDISENMLSKAIARLNKYDCLLLNQDLCELDLFGTINTCFCTLDSLNHITNKNDFKKAIKKISLFMEKDGLFIFDLNTQFKHRTILGNNFFVEETKDYYLVWKNQLLLNDTVEINLDVFVNSNETYTRFSENFCERAYSLEEINNILTNSSFKVLEMLDFFTHKKPNAKSEKIIFVAKKL